uniref:Glycosyltransferase n=1 Tax=Candidatus Caldatribacterium saccharofermentans TaxID=1454753 RepID=A0A7V4TH12_9BACT
MPLSFVQAIPVIIEQVAHLKPSSILDVGIGFGKYGVLLREALELPYERYARSRWKVKIDGVEAFEGYRNPIHEFAYNRVFYGRIEEILSSLGQYDVILLIDVLEHFEKEEGKKLLQDLLLHARKSLLVSTPRFPAPQGAYLGNAFEAHKSRWHILDFVDFDFSYLHIPIGNNGAEVFHLFPTQSASRKQDDAVFIPEAQEKESSGPLTIGAYIPHKHLTGGMKMFFEYLRILKRRGHNIVLFWRGERNESAIPEWSLLGKGEVQEILISPHEPILPFIKGCNVVIALWFQQMEELAESPVPVVLFEQGSEFLFGDYQDLRPDSPVRQLLQKNYAVPWPIITVSPLLGTILKIRYGRNTTVVPNGVDTDFYRPGREKSNNTVLLVGNPQLRFKGFDIALQALEKAWRIYPNFEVHWVCQVSPRVYGISFPLKIVLNPPQDELARHYREATVFLFTSWYEGFGLPPLEAMASGTAVVATDCGGIRTYAQEGYNALLAEPGDVDSLAYALVFLLQNEEARKVLEERGRATALEFSLEKQALKFEEVLQGIARNASLSPFSRTTG